MSQARVLIADDHPSVRRLLVRLLTGHFAVAGAVADGTLLVEAAVRLSPDVIVTDLSMPGLHGFEVLERLRAARSKAKIVVLTMHADGELAAQAIRAGASAFVLKVSAADELPTAINEALQGRVYVTPAIRD